jgi:hypothetical protein
MVLDLTEATLGRVEIWIIRNIEHHFKLELVHFHHHFLLRMDLQIIEKNCYGLMFIWNI